MSTPLVALTLAGTDSGGGAGIAADLATFAALGVHGACAVTAVTAQDTTAVHRVVLLSPADVRAQVDAVLADLPVGVVKTGMLGSAGVAAVVAELPRHLLLVVDPVLRASTGAALADAELVAAYRDAVLPHADVVTPNLTEALRLCGRPAGERADPVTVAAELQRLGPAVVLTGGDPDADRCRDVVVDRGGATHVLSHRTVATRNDHGTGCTFAAALAVHLARGADLVQAARSAHDFLAAALRTAAGWRLGHGRGPVAHTRPETCPHTCPHTESSTTPTRRTP